MSLIIPLISATFEIVQVTEGVSGSVKNLRAKAEDMDMCRVFTA